MTGRAFLAAGLALCLTFPAVAAPPEGPLAHDRAPHLPWSFDGPLGNFDLAAVQRGYAVYDQVCSACHSMAHVHFSDLREAGLTEEQVRAIAGRHKVPDGPDASGRIKMRPARENDAFPVSPVAAGLIPGAVVPPDQSRLEVVYPGRASRIYALLTGYADPPPGVTPPPGLFYNRFAQGRAIAMPPPLHDGGVTYADGTRPTAVQQARDVTTFLAWVARPHLADRHRTGVRVVLWLSFLAVLLFILKRRLWSDVH